MTDARLGRHRTNTGASLLPAAEYTPCRDVPWYEDQVAWMSSWASTAILATLSPPD